MRSFSLLFALLLLPLLLAAEPPHLKIAEKYVGLTEEVPNGGPEVAVMLSAVGIDHPAPWCAAFVGYVLRQSGAESPLPSAVAFKYISRNSISSTDYLNGTRTVPIGSVFVMRRGNTWQGHTGFVTSIDENMIRTIEGNTSPDPVNISADRDGDGVFKRKRWVNPGNYFRITHFTPVHYPS